MDKFISEDIAHGATLGPFETNPFESQIHLSPLQTVPKDSVSRDRRIVVYLSYPGDTSVNAGIPRQTFMGSAYDLHYPSIDNLARMVRDKGAGSLLFKKDISRAYRQIFTCPHSWNKTGYSWRGRIYIDIVEVFGLRSSAMAMQRTTNSITHMFRVYGYSCVNYVDDFGGVEFPSKARGAFRVLGLLLDSLNLKENIKKACAPATRMIFLGIMIDTVSMTLSIPAAKLAAAQELLRAWLHRDTATRKQLQSLLGTLNHIAACVRPGRTFLNRMLNTLRSPLPSPESKMLGNDTTVSQIPAPR